MGKGIIKNTGEYTDNFAINRTMYKTYEEQKTAEAAYGTNQEWSLGTLRPYIYQADGEGVDIVIDDLSFGNKYTPDFLGADGEYRLQRVNWAELAGAEQHEIDFHELILHKHYNEGGEHGGNTASSAAGYLGGAAKGAHIYSIRDYWVSGRGTDEYQDPVLHLGGLSSHHHAIDGNPYNNPELNRGYEYGPEDQPEDLLFDPTNTNDSVNNYYYHKGKKIRSSYELLVQWHRNKMADGGNKRPTIYVSSASTGMPTGGYELLDGTMPVRGNYRGTPWTYNGETRKELYEQYGIISSDGSGYFNNKIYMGANASKYAGHPDNLDRPADSDSAAYHYAAPEEPNPLVEEGIHVFVAAMNFPLYQDVNPEPNDDARYEVYPAGVLGQDWDNWFEISDNYSGTAIPIRYYYHRGKNEPNVHVAGSTDVDDIVTPENPNGDYREALGWLGGGPIITSFGDQYAGARSPTDDFNHIPYDLTVYEDAQKAHYKEPNFTRSSYDEANRHPHPVDPNFSYGKFSGTSSVCPMSAGVAACYLEKEPHLTPKELLKKMLEDAGTTNWSASTSYFPPRPDWSNFEPKTLFNPYAKPHELRAKGKFYFTSGKNKYAENSDLVSEKDKIFTHYDATSDLTLQLKDENGQNADTAGLLVNFSVSEGTLTNVVDHGDGTYSATLTAPASGTGDIIGSATSFNKSFNDTLNIPYTSNIPPALVSTNPTDPTNLVHHDDFLNNVHVFSMQVDQPDVTFTLGGDDAEYFSVTQDYSGEIGTVRHIDNFDSYVKDTYNFSITAANAADSITINLSFVVIDLNPPRIIVQPLVPTDFYGSNNSLDFMALEENSHPIGTDLVKVTADDRHLPATLEVVSDTGTFTFIPDPNDPASGIIRLTGPLDYEVLGNSPEITYKATDALGNAHSYSGRRFAFYLTNVDDTPPEFTSGLNVVLETDTLQGEVIYTATAFDPTDNGSSVVTYSLKETYHYDKLNIDSSTGEVTLAEDASDAYNFILFTVIASDETGNQSERFVQVQMIPPIPPTINSLSAGDNISELNPFPSYPYTYIYIANASEAVTWELENTDTGETGTSITAMNQPDATLSISSLGQVIISGEVDFETSPTLKYVVRATADDNGASAEKLITHNITDVYEGNIDFTYTSGFTTSRWQQAVTLTFAENQVSGGTHLLTITPDQTITDIPVEGCTFSISGDNAANINVDQNGVVRASRSFDYETDGGATISSMVVNITSPAGVTTHAFVQINLVNVDEEAPYLTSGTSINDIPFPADVSAGTPLFTLDAADDQDTTTGSWTFSIISHADPSGPKFIVNNFENQGDFFWDGSSPALDYGQSIQFSVNIEDEAGNSNQYLIQANTPAVPDNRPNLADGNWHNEFTAKVNGTGTGHTDMSGYWRMAEIPFNNGTAISGNVWLKATSTASTFWKNDFAVAYVEVVDDNDEIFYYIKPFGYTARTTTAALSGQPNSPSYFISNHTSMAYMGVLAEGTSGTTRRWNLGTSTASSSTGPQSGPSSYYYSGSIGDTSQLTWATESTNLSMIIDSPYFYREATSGGNGHYSVMTGGWTPTTMPEKGKIRILYFNSGDSGIDENNTLAVAMG